MPANLTPEYKAAETSFRKARDNKERLQCLREMLRTIPKHKGSEHLQADIKTRIKELSEELGGPKKGPARGGPATVIRPEGAAQIALLGPPNVGKSALHARLTGSSAQVAPYPFTTQFPQPGMLPYADIHFQLIDLPPISHERPIPWIGNALQPADAGLLVVDLGDPECVDQVMAVHEILAAKRVTLSAQWNNVEAESEEADEIAYDPFAVDLPTLLLATKADTISGLPDEIRVFYELTGLRYPVLSVSAETGTGLEQLGPWLFQGLHIVRVYTKAPGRPPDTERPFTVRRGQTVHEVAALIHQELSQSLKYARLWRADKITGQQVGGEHKVVDGDILELRA